MRDSNRKLSLRLFLTIGPYEEDEGFKELLRSLAQRTLLLYGLLGIIVAFIYVLSHIYIKGDIIRWNIFELASRGEVLMIDKALVVVFCLTLILLSRIPVPLNMIRILVFGIAWFSNLAMMMPDLITQDISFTTPYTTICILFAIAVVPYKGWHTALLCLAMIITTESVIEFVPGLFDMESLDHKLGNLIYIYAVSIFLTFMTSQIYVNRYEQYSARKQVEKLKNQLEERAQLLQSLKDKSDDQAERIRKNEQLKDRFFTNISHDFRTPLTLILGPLKDLLSQKYQDDAIEVNRASLHRMHENGLRMLSMINQLFDLTKIDAGQVHLNLSEVDLNEFVKNILLSFSPLAEKEGVELVYDFHDQPVPIHVDKEQMERAISNLISNAIRFTETGGTIKVDIITKKRLTNKVQLKVSDTGEGIPEEDLPQVFDRFYQAETSFGKKSGTGIGLALVKEIIELHEGTITVESEVGRGTEFIITLDKGLLKNKAQAKTITKGKKLSEPISAYNFETDSSMLKEDEDYQVTDKDPTIVVIDDNPEILSYLKTHLSQRYNVRTYESSSKALEAIQKEHVQLIISDVMMPEPDGFEVCKIIKEDPDLNHIPIILLTARAAEESRLEGLELGADDYINKPFSASELMVRVENLIELRKILRQRFSQEVNIKGEKVEVSSEDARFLQRVQGVIDEQMENSNFGVDWLADEVALSTRQLQRKIRAITDLSAGGYIRLIRLERASQLLSQEWGNVSEIAYKVGFQDPKYFSRLFKQTFGDTPTEYAEKEH